MRALLLKSGQSLLGGIGLAWLVVESYSFFTLDTTSLDNLILFVLSGAVIGGLWFCLDGYLISCFLKRSITISSNAFDTSITVTFGDVLAKDGYIAISVNEFFDSTVDDKHVAHSSLHGLILTRFWGGNILDWDNQVEQELANLATKEHVAERTSGKKTRYPIGTTAHTSARGHEFLCVALAKTDTKTLQASASCNELSQALHGLLSKARSVCAGQPLNIPLLGSGLARIGLKPNIIVDMILVAVFEESKHRKITNEIRIILPKPLARHVNLATIHDTWR